MCSPEPTSTVRLRPPDRSSTRSCGSAERSDDVWAHRGSHPGGGTGRRTGRCARCLPRRAVGAPDPSIASMARWMATSWLLSERSSLRSASRIPLLDIVTCSSRASCRRIAPSAEMREHPPPAAAETDGAATDPARRIRSPRRRPARGSRPPHASRPRSTPASRRGSATPVRPPAGPGTVGPTSGVRGRDPHHHTADHHGGDNRARRAVHPSGPPRRSTPFPQLPSCSS